MGQGRRKVRSSGLPFCRGQFGSHEVFERQDTLVPHHPPDGVTGTWRSPEGLASALRPEQQPDSADDQDHAEDFARVRLLREKLV